MKNTFIALVFSVFALNAYAGVDNTDVYCSKVRGAVCSSRVLVAFQNLGCEPLENSVRCQEDRAGRELCTIQSYCREPNYGLVGQVTCYDGKTVNLASVDRGLTLTVSVGLIRHYVTEICK